MLTIDDELLRTLMEFRDARGWKQFHTPRNLAASLVIEASELLECFQWARDSELAQIVSERRESIEDELADVAILFTYLCVDLHVDLASAVHRKIVKNTKKYPIGRAWGTAKKYDRL